MVPPGSFTKNFGWGDAGFQKLKDAIRVGFAGGGERVGREMWRGRNAYLGSDLPLVALNFFLLNDGSDVVMDELVFAAIQDIRLDCFNALAFFAFNLSAVGHPPKTLPRPAPWANDFVRHELWRNGTWIMPADLTVSLDTCIRSGVSAQSDESFVKLRNNYRWIFHGAFNCRVNRIDGLQSINTRFQEWLPSAMFLLWDRLAPNDASEDQLLGMLKSEQVHKLAGCPWFSVQSIQDQTVARYVNSGRIHRFANPPNTSDLTVLAIEPVESVHAGSGDYPIDSAFAGQSVPRRTVISDSAIRNAGIVDRLKRLYDNQCVICALRLHVGGGRFYSEGAHIVPIGNPHCGPDEEENVVLLCPNHHKQFDYGAISIDSRWRVWAKSPEGSIEQTGIVRFRHDVRAVYLGWHAQWMMGIDPS